MGAKITTLKKFLLIDKPKILKETTIATKPYPGFPTDLQAQFMVLATQAKGISKLKKIFLKIDLCTCLS